MIRSLVAFVFCAAVGQSLLIACSCAQVSVPGPCGNLAGTPVKGSITFVGTVTSAEHGGIIKKGANDVSPLAYYHFQVDELIAGLAEISKVDIVSTRGGGDCSAHFQTGVKYLIYAYQAQDGAWSTSICSGNRLASEAAFFLQQLRAQRRGEKIPSIYGTLRRVEEAYDSVRSSDYERVLAAVRIRLRGGDQIFESITDAEGRYMLYNLPQGKYRIEADLPSGIELGQTILRDPPPPVNIAHGACLEHEITATPKARIVGHVITDSGVPVDLASVTLYREELFRTKGSSLAWRETQRGSKLFVFDHIAPGSYILVFNDNNDRNADAPFSRTFFGDVGDLAHAKRIVVPETDGSITADIHVRGGSETRKIRVNVVGEDGKPYADAFLLLRPSSGFPMRQGDGVYTVNLFRDTAYQITAQSFCLLETGGLSRAKISQTLDSGASEMTLVLPREPCKKQKEP